MPRGFIPKHGGYRKLLTYQRSEIVYDATVRFCQRNFDRFDRTVGQMVQAARSGKQNIVEGSMASATSKETEIKLTNVARASLEELLEDYRDFLRLRGEVEWPKEHRLARRVGELMKADVPPHDELRKAVEHDDPVIAANAIMVVIKVTSYLLHRQIDQLEVAFLREGGLRERMRNARTSARNQDGSSQTR
jgi:four helix bundle suffix protein